ncbi:MAG TPA: RluA family pseudouridine synthase [Candidatus Polarisedimenticolia bacterium]|nr:RluA family pseudouridine synthase [Candidatus Polarisedimenticolia bacterium]
MRSLVLEVAPEDAGRTLQAILHDRGGFSHSEARGLIDAGSVRLPAGGRDRASRPIGPGEYARRVAAGERYEIQVDSSRRYRPQPPPRPGEGYRIIHQERELLVVEKQPRLLSVPTPLREDEDSLVERLLESERDRGVRRPALYALHRLDWDTSGLLLFARSRRAFEALEAQFKTRTIERIYTAVAKGRVEPDEGRFESHLVEDPRSLKVHSTRRPGEGKEAITEYTVTERLPGATVLSVRLRTGRRNQIRVHLAEAGHSLIGDRSYGRRTSLIGRTALHARTLRFVHPVTGQRVEFESSLPRDMRHLIKALRRGVAAEQAADPDAAGAAAGAGRPGEAGRPGPAGAARRPGRRRRGGPGGKHPG